MTTLQDVAQMSVFKLCLVAGYCYYYPVGYRRIGWRISTFCVRVCVAVVQNQQMHLLPNASNNCFQIDLTSVRANGRQSFVYICCTGALMVANLI